MTNQKTIINNPRPYGRGSKLGRLDTNKQWWEKMVEEKCGFTTPWLSLDPAIVQKVANGKISPPSPLDIFCPITILKDVKGKDVLCLASGGGQQSAVFGILGANVSVIDIADGQLVGDKKAAEHYGYKVITVQGSMDDLSAFKDDSFDLVYQAPSMCYVPSVKKVYQEVARVLRSGGLYLADAQNPLAQFVDETSWDGQGYRVTVPYSVKEKQRAENKNVIEHRHYLSEVFNGLIDSGFVIKKVSELSAMVFSGGEKVKPGNWLHLGLYLPGMLTILARKK